MFSDISHDQSVLSFGANRWASRIERLSICALSIVLGLGCKPSVDFGYHEEASRDSGPDDSTEDSGDDSSVESEVEDVLLPDLNMDADEEPLSSFDAGGCSFANVTEGMATLDHLRPWTNQAARTSTAECRIRWPCSGESGDVNGGERDELAWGVRNNCSVWCFWVPSSEDVIRV